jgi:signal transduction histidine kinase
MPISSISFVRVTILSILIGLAALLAIVAVNLWLVRQAADYSATVALATQERAAIVELRNTLDDAETGQRGYLLTNGNQDYLAPYNEAQRRVRENTDRLAALTKSDPAMAADVAKLIPTMDAKLAELQKTIDLFNTSQREASLKLVNTDLGKRLMDEARELFATMVGRSEARIDAATRSQKDSIDALQWVTIGGALVILLVVGGSVWAVFSYTGQLEQARKEVSTLNVNLEQRVRERTADLGRANEEIQRFAYIVTHDLRAPLVNIMGFTSELETSLASIQSYIKKHIDEAAQDEIAKQAQIAVLEEVPEAVSFIRSSTRKMDGLINAILKLSREGRRALRPEWISLDTLFKTAAASLQHQIDDAGGAVNIDTRVSTLVSDRLALEQIVGNLLDNAVKYRAPDRALRIHIRAHETRGQRIIVEVEDNGRGIAAQDHERVFDLFRRSGAQNMPGEGIGLAHVRSMVRNLGGEITLRSQIEQGTTMQLNLPRDLRAILATQTGAA